MKIKHIAVLCALLLSGCTALIEEYSATVNANGSSNKEGKERPIEKGDMTFAKAGINGSWICPPNTDSYKEIKGDGYVIAHLCVY